MVRGAEQDEDAQVQRPSTPTTEPKSPPRTPVRTLEAATQPNDDGDDGISSNGNGEEEDEDEEEDEEPLLKYATLTKNQGNLYRNADSVSTFMVAGEKMIVGTHNGNVHVFALPSFHPIRVYKAHSTSITAISISPYPPPLPTAGKSKAGQDQNGGPPSPRHKPEGAKNSPRAGSQVPNTPSNSIHIATSSIDGNVVVQSLVEARDVIMRNFGRPVHTVSLSPDFKNDKTYISGGNAGLLVKTVGGTPGKSSTSTTIGGAAATAQGWLGTVGLGGDEGKDTVLHSGEGKINTIKWSLSGKYVVWVNEQGIKIMRSHLHFEAGIESELAWKRMSHIDRPNRADWEEMAGVWKARAEWVDEDGLETNADPSAAPRDEIAQGSESPKRRKESLDTKRVERLLIGWGGSIWIMDVYPSQTSDARASNNARLGKVEVVTILRTDCIISGLSLYTPNLLLVLAYITPDNSNEDTPQTRASPGTPSGGRRRRQNALPPEMRIIDIRTKEEVSLADPINVNRFNSLQSTDYHLDTLPVIRQGTKVMSSKGALEVMGEFGSNIYGGIWDVAMYPKHLLSSGASIISNDFENDKASARLASSLGSKKAAEPNLNPALLTRGIKIFIHSPFDCVLATKPTISDHFRWLESQQEYEKAWNLLDERPEAADGPASEVDSVSSPSTPTKGAQSLKDWFADDASISMKQGFYSQASKEKRRIGDLWVDHLVKSGEWQTAGEVAGKVVDTVKSWERWYWMFAKADKFAEIVPYLPNDRLPNQPMLSSTVYEDIMEHFIADDPPRFAEVTETWSSDLFDPGTVISAIENRLRTGDIRQDSVEDGQKGKYWRILYDGLAKMYLAAGRYRDALKAYIRLQDAETALALIKTEQLAQAVADDIPSLILLRVSKDQLKNASTEELEEASTDIIQLLVAEAYRGIIPTSTVISQLKSRKDLRPFLFFYFRALWMGLDASGSRPLAPTPSSDPKHILSANFSTSPVAQVVSLSAARSTARELDESRALVNDAADTALPLFATYDRPIFAMFLRASQTYTLSLASQLCEEHDYIPELVYLFAKEGRAKRALHLILDRLGDVMQAMAFAREQADPELWDDLVEYSLNRPEFVKVLLEEAGSAGSSAGGIGGGVGGSGLDPVALVRKIPDGMEIEGLKEALGRMLREFELRASISEGVLRVCRGEVSGSMHTLRTGQKAGVKFDIQSLSDSQQRPGSRSNSIVKEGGKLSGLKSLVLPQQRSRKKKRRRPPALILPGHCAACGDILLEDEPKSLISFPCRHVFHLPCLILYESMPPEQQQQQQQQQLDDIEADGEHASGSLARRPGTASSKLSAKKGGPGAADHMGDGPGGDGAGRAAGRDEDDESDPEAELGLPDPEPDSAAAVGRKVRYAKIIRGRVAGGCPLTVHAAA